MTPKPLPKRRVTPGRAIEWTDADLDDMAEIHVTDDTPLMLAFVRQYAPPRLAAVLLAQPEDNGATTGNA